LPYSLTLTSLGWDVLATDIPNVISTVLSQNITQNVPILPAHSGAIDVRELDWTVSPEKWSWDSQVIASASSNATQDLKPSLGSSRKLLGPPFDLIVTSDTIYSPELAQPLLRTLFALCSASRRTSACALNVLYPPIYMCIERRDPALIDRTLAEARSIWGFTAVRIPHRKVVRAMEKGGLKWIEEDWEGVEIWKLTLSANAKLSLLGQT